MSILPATGTTQSNTSPRALLATTPGRLWAMFAVIVFVTLVTWPVLSSNLDFARASIKTITKDSVPSVIAAQQIRMDLLKLDGDVVSNYLASNHGSPAKYDLLADREAAADQLVLAAQNITFGESEGRPIRKMVSGLSLFALDSSVDPHIPVDQAAPKLLQATHLVSTDLAPDANELDKVNRSKLAESFDRVESTIGPRALRCWILGILLVGVMIYAQVTLAKMFRRIINVPFAIAFVLATVMVFSSANTISYLGSELKTAKKDCFDSIGALAEAQAIGASTRSIALHSLLPGGENLKPQIDADLALLADIRNANDLILSPQSPPPSFKGLLGDELRNITFPGEQESATNAFSAFRDFAESVRAVELTNPTRPGQTKEAVSTVNSIDLAFDRLSAAIEDTKQLNQRQFELSRDRAERAIAFPIASTGILSVLIIILSFFGFRQRLNEYQ